MYSYGSSKSLSSPIRLTQKIQQCKLRRSCGVTAAVLRPIRKVRVHCAGGAGDDGGSGRGAGKSTAPEEPKSPRNMLVLAGKLVQKALELTLPAAPLFAGMYLMSKSLDVRAVGQGRDFSAPPLTEVMREMVGKSAMVAESGLRLGNRAVTLGEQALTLGDHITVKKQETRFFVGALMVAFVVGTGVGESRKTQFDRLLRGVAFSSAVVVVSAFRAKAS